ncbi:nuclear transport factor 2 family protein [Umezawaea sp.]|uniref:nuclear transport factor 2 family protein n=1 Tax=Umezawaea sp. TaxID=1955258 RepID=UPI002ED60630
MTSRSPSTAELVHLVLARFGATDAAGVARLFAPEVEWRAPDVTSARWTSGIRTRREVESFFLSAFSALDLEGISVHRLLVDGEDAAVLGRMRWRPTSTSDVVDADFSLSLSVHDGEVDGCWLLHDTLAVAMALGAVRTWSP